MKVAWFGALAVAGLSILTALGGIVAAEVASTWPSAVQIANVEQFNMTVEGNFQAAPQADTVEPSFGGSTRFPLSDLFALSLTSSTTLKTHGTTTLGVYARATLSAVSTTAATSSQILAAVQNTGGPKYCWGAGVQIDADQAVNPSAIQVSLGTSTDGLQYAGVAGSGSGLLATTTAPTNTDIFIQSTTTYPGLAYNVTSGSNAAFRPQLFPLANGDWVIAKWNSLNFATASATDFATMRSQLDVWCVIKK